MRQVNTVLLSQLKADAIAVKQIGAPLLACQGMFVPRDMPDMRFLVKSCPRPTVTHGDPVLVEMAGGHTAVIPGPVKDAFTGTLQILETEAGHTQMFAELVHANHGSIDCDYYDGRVDSFTRVFEFSNCAIRFDIAEFDTDSKSQAMIISCPIDFNWYGNFAAIGTNGSIQLGKRHVEGADGLLSRVQSVINTANAAINLTNQGANLVRGVGALFG